MPIAALISRFMCSGPRRGVRFRAVGPAPSFTQRSELEREIEQRATAIHVVRAQPVFAVVTRDTQRLVAQVVDLEPHAERVIQLPGGAEVEDGLFSERTHV